MRPSSLLGVLSLTACGGASASVEGSAGGIAWGESQTVYVGARYVVISATELDCRDVDWIDRNYDEGVKPTDLNVSTLQFTFASGDRVEEGKFPIAQGAAVQATIVNVSGDVFHEYNATGGALIVDSAEDEGSATGSFEAVAFEDGTLSGSFTAEFCVNLKP
jgi:hypothetical protein